VVKNQKFGTKIIDLNAKIGKSKIRKNIFCWKHESSKRIQIVLKNQKYEKKNC